MSRDAVKKMNDAYSKAAEKYPVTAPRAAVKKETSQLSMLKENVPGVID